MCCGILILTDIDSESCLLQVSNLKIKIHHDIDDMKGGEKNDTFRNESNVKKEDAKENENNVEYKEEIALKK